MPRPSAGITDSGSQPFGGAADQLRLRPAQHTGPGGIDAEEHPREVTDQQQVPADLPDSVALGRALLNPLFQGQVLLAQLGFGLLELGYVVEGPDHSSGAIRIFDDRAAAYDRASHAVRTDEIVGVIVDATQIAAVEGLVDPHGRRGRDLHPFDIFRHNPTEGVFLRQHTLTRQAEHLTATRIHVDGAGCRVPIKRTQSRDLKCGFQPAPDLRLSLFGRLLAGHFGCEQQHACKFARLALYGREAVGPDRLLIPTMPAHRQRQVLDGEPFTGLKHRRHLRAKYGGDVSQHLRHRSPERPGVPLAEGFAVGVVIEQPLLRPPVEGGNPLGVQHQR